ncbi:hypothetical protein ABMY47_21095 [Pseudoalteromonas sp. BZP1]|uniref:hypothetical protein n=1 Tax=unclassified Pseudoalteromonas TaxID=194690 RepID=UPI002592B0FA|nr:hypothetical protein [uncultured Pseudoalteromonas sp.]
MSTDIEPMYIDCGKHGKRVAAVVCGHLVKPEGEPLGFIENSSVPNDLQAWCYQCEAVFEEEDGMTEDSESLIKCQSYVLTVTNKQHSITM